MMRDLFPQSTCMLASVLSADEASAAAAGGACVIDVKNPFEGALGAPLPSVIRKIRSVTPGDLHVSAALGDMPCLPGTAALAALGAASAGATILKAGLYGPSNETEAFDLLAAVTGTLENFFPDTVLVAGAYADAACFGGVGPLDVPRCSARAGAAGCLLDTFDKSSGRGLTDLLGLDVIRDFVERCRGRGLFCALAGSLGPEDVSLLLPLKPDYLGFRGALCSGGRTSSLVREKVESLAALMP